MLIASTYPILTTPNARAEQKNMCHRVKATGYGNPEKESTHLLYMMTVALRKIHVATYLQHKVRLQV